MSHDAILAVLAGSTGTLVYASIARHMPDWPITWKGMYEWFRGSIQEIAAQKSGQAPQNPTNPVSPDKK